MRKCKYHEDCTTSFQAAIERSNYIDSKQFYTINKMLDCQMSINIIRYQAWKQSKGLESWFWTGACKITTFLVTFLPQTCDQRCKQKQRWQIHTIKSNTENVYFTPKTYLNKNYKIKEIWSLSHIFGKLELSFYKISHKEPNFC